MGIGHCPSVRSTVHSNPSGAVCLGSTILGISPLDLFHFLFIIIVHFTLVLYLVNIDSFASLVGNCLFHTNVFCSYIFAHSGDL